MEKYHKTDIAPVEQENERDETYRASNPQIDRTRTGGNYHIVKRQRSYTQFINDKIEALDLPTKVRKDAVLMCSFVVGSDRKFFGELSPSEQQQFFAECTRFFAEHYGEGNIISAVVHMDETTPHLHLNLIPIAGGRLCAKKLFDRKALTALQTDLHREVGVKWNLQRGKEGSQAKHLDTAEFKAKKIVEQARGEADSIIAEADHNAERKVKNRANLRGWNPIAGETDGGENKSASAGISGRRRAEHRGGAQQAHAEAKTASRGRTFRSPHGERRPAAIESYCRPRSQRPVRAVAESRTPRQRQGASVRDGKRYARDLPRRVRRSLEQVTGKENRPAVQVKRQQPRRQIKLNNRIQGEKRSSKLHNNGE